MRRADLVQRCSFCHKSESEHGIRLISGPSDYPQAHICNECARVCASVVADDLVAGAQAPVDAEPSVPAAPPESPLSHPMASELLTLVEQWITREASGHDASGELSQLRAAAQLMFVNRDA
jgi:hypothetical protein